MVETRRVFQLKYEGTRFNKARLPVDVLQDIPAFKDLLVSYAKDAWRRRNKDKQRLPNGFEANLSLSLFQIDEGSAVPKLEWVHSSDADILPGIHEEIDEVVDQAYSDVLSLIAGTSVRAAALSREKTAAIYRFGIHLNKAEKIIIPANDGGKPAIYNSARRTAILEKARETYTKEIEDSGELIGTSIPSGYEGFLQIRTREYGEITLQTDPLRIYEEFSKRLNKFLRFKISAELDSTDQIRRVNDVFEVEVIEDETLSRLAEIRSLRKGWHAGRGTQISSKALNNADQFFSEMRPRKTAFNIFPVETGGVLVDFETADWDYSIEFLADGAFKMYGIAIDGPEELEPQRFRDYRSFKDYLKKLVAS